MKLTPCPSCSKRLSPDANACPKCGKPLVEGWAVLQQAKQKKQQTKAALWTIGVLGGLFAIGALSEANSTPETRQAETCADRGRLEAFGISKRFVQKRLRSPSTAEFPSFRADGIVTKWIGDCDFHVTSFVDAQNGFGAKVRSTYDVTVTYLPGTKEWRLKEISIE